MLRVDVERIRRAVVRVRGQNVLLDADLAALYRVDVRVLNQAVSRNVDRFPSDFMFELTDDEAESLRSQFVILKRGRGRHRKYRLKAFTEEGVAMLSSVLRSQRAVRVNIEIMRTFVQLRRVLGANEELARKLDALEQKYDGQFRVVLRAIRELMTPSQPRRRTIGFRAIERASVLGAMRSRSTRFILGKRFFAAGGFCRRQTDKLVLVLPESFSDTSDAAVAAGTSA